MQRNARQAAILDIISKKEIETQEELCEELNRMNFNVTQATISRDIKELKLYKVAGSEKKYRYAYLSDEDGAATGKMHNLFRDCVQSVTYVNNLILVKAIRCNGATAGMFVESLQIPEILGTISGDDTLLIIVDSNENTPRIAEKLREYLS